MRNLMVWVVAAGLFCVLACSKQDEKVESLEAQASALIKMANDNEDRFKSAYLGKEVRVNNLVTYSTWNTETERYTDAFAYDPTTETIFTSGQSKLDGTSLQAGEPEFFIKVVFADPAEQETLTDSKEETVDGQLIRNYAAPFSVRATVRELNGNNITLGTARLVH